MSSTTASMPSLSMVRMPLEETRRLTKRFSLSSQKRWVCRFGSQRRRVLLFACETLLPVVGALPVTWQTLDMTGSSGYARPERPDERAAILAAGGGLASYFNDLPRH